MLTFIIYKISIISQILLFQIPRNIPGPADNEPLILNSPFDYFLAIGMPVIILITFYYWRKRKKKKQEE